MRKPVKPIPYANATSGVKAREEIGKLLASFGCTSVGFMDDYAEHSVMLAFTHRGREVQLKASAKGWADMYLKANPHHRRARMSKHEYEQRALKQGLVAVNSILRDWIKGHVTAIECGVLSFEAVFLPYMLTADGRTVIERAKQANLLPSPSA